MVKDTRSARKAKDDDASSSKKNLSTSLRRSSRETSSKKETSSSPSNARRSERLVNLTPRKSPAKKLAEKVGKGNSSSLRRSERVKFQPSGLSSLKKSKKGSSSTKGEKKEKCVKELAMQAKAVYGMKKRDSNAGSKRKKRLDARSYRAMFKVHKKKLTISDSTKQRRIIKYSPDSSSGTGGNVPEKVQVGEADLSDCSEDRRRKCTSVVGDVDVESSNSDPKKLASGTLKDEFNMGSSDSVRKDDHTEDTCESVGGFSFQVSGSGNLPLPCADGGEVERDLDSGRRVQVDPSDAEKLQEEELHFAADQLFCDDVNLAGGHKRIVPKRNRCKVNCSCEVCAKSSKRQRVENDSAMQELSGSKKVTVQVLIQDAIQMPKDSSSDAQKHTEQSTCAKCKLVGKLLRCEGKGCKRSYHPGCLDPPLKDVHPGVWHCSFCVKKKIELGVHSVSDGVESIWDIKEVEVVNSAGVQKQKEYFVKYKGLAHFHNCWMPESQLLDEASNVLVKYDQEKEIQQWKPEWIVPHHLLQKRLLKVPENSEHVCQDVAVVSSCQHEWLVKWCGLDYDHVTWELEDASFFKKPEGQLLIKEYEARRNKMKKISKGSPKNFSKLPAGFLPGVDSCYLNSVNKLREYWHRGQNSFMFNEQDHLAKVVYFTVSLRSNVSQPFLIITPSTLLYSWEAEFIRLAPAFNVVVYSGSRDALERIRHFEFQEGGCLMFEILLSTPEAVSEDLDALKCITWEALVLDECQHSDVVAHTNDIKELDAKWKLLLTSIHMKESVPDYLNILSLLKCGANSDVIDKPKSDKSHTISMLKQRLSPFIVTGCKSYPSRFVEFWVPVQISNVQLEQYCYTLLSKRTALRSCSKNDLVGVLREILVSTRKCCDHPYVVNLSLYTSLMEGRPIGDILDVGVKASGKLQLLDAILSESRNLGLRMLVLFQSIGGSGRDGLGDILEDCLQRRFGADSYERVDGGITPSQKQTALKNFNNEKTRFVFLLETRACLPSIKLSSVDAVIIFDSDWNPVNDLRALQRITIHSKFEQINVFRLYSFCTIEENVLMLARKEMTLDIQSISPGTSRMLLMWGASYLFSKLDEFHRDNLLHSSANLVPEDSLLNDVLQEFLSVVMKHDHISCKFISRAQQNGGSYWIPFLLGEQKAQQTVEEQPHNFWGRLLDEGLRKWKFLSLSSQRNRKRVRYFDHSSSLLDDYSNDNQNKRKKVGGNNVASGSLKAIADGGAEAGCGEEIKGDSGNKTNKKLESAPKSVSYMSQPSRKTNASKLPVVADDISAVPEAQMVESEEKRKLHDEQRSLHHLLKPQISKLCEILQLPEDVKKLGEQFLDYVINNNRVSREPESVLQAFQISVCWTAASLLAHKIDHRESLAVAQEHLKFNCKEDEADLIFSKMQTLKKLFLLWYSKHSSPVTNGPARETVDANSMDSALPSLQNVTVKVEEGSAGPECSDRQAFTSMHTVEIRKREIFKNLKKVQKKCRKRMGRLKQKHIKEAEEFRKLWEEKKARLEKEHRLESAVIRSIHSNLPVRIDKLKILDSDYAKKYQELEHQMSVDQRALEAGQRAEKNEEEQRTARLLEVFKSLAQAELSDKLLLLESQDRVDQLDAFGQPRIPEHLKDTSSVSGDLLGQQRSGRVASEVSDGEVNIVASDAGAFKGDKQDICSHNGSTDFSLETHIAHGAVSDSPFGTEPPDSRLTNNVGTQVSPAVHAEMTMLGRSVEVLVEPCEAADREAMHGDKHNEMRNPDMEKDRDTNHINFVASRESIPVGTNQYTGASISVPTELTHAQHSLVNSYLVQPVADPTECQLVNQGLGEDPDQSLNQMHGWDEPVTELQNTLIEAETPASRHSEALCDAARSSATTVSELTVTNHLGHNNQSFCSIETPEDRPSGNHTSQQRALAPMQQDDNPDLSNSACSQSLADSVVHPSAPSNSTRCVPDARASPALTESNNYPMQAFASAVSRLPSHSSSDPLQIELERIHREVDQTTKIHEDLMLRIESECEKEIEEVVTQIRRKYQVKRQEVEASFLQKKRELDANQSKVLMNKILAEAFRSKCIDYRASSGLQQATPHQLLPLQQSAARPAAAGAYSAGPSSVSTESIAISTHVVHSSPIFRGTMARPPHISSITPSAGNQQHVASEVRARPPHLHFRPPIPPSSIKQSPSVPCVTTCQQSTSTVHPASAPSTFGLVPLGPPPALDSSSCTNVLPHQGGSIGRFAPPLHLSAMELLRDIGTHGTQAGALPSLSDQWNLPVPGTSGNNTQPSSSHAAAVADVVCLSDDE
ncbi:hypothetical protein Ancab_030018 [Ancistrocladus abbreviatus]